MMYPVFVAVTFFLVNVRFLIQLGTIGVPFSLIYLLGRVKIELSLLSIIVSGICMYI